MQYIRLYSPSIHNSVSELIENDLRLFFWIGFIAVHCLYLVILSESGTVLLQYGVTFFVPFLADLLQYPYELEVIFLGQFLDTVTVKIEPRFSGNTLN